MSILALLHKCKIIDALRRSSDVRRVFGFVLAIAGGCSCIILMINEDFEVNRRVVQNIVLLYVSAISFGYSLDYFIGIPNVLSALLVGIILKNCGIVEEFPRGFSDNVRRVSLTWILLLSGMEIDLTKVGRMSFRLMLCPGVIEAFATAGVSLLLFDMPFPLSLSLGFILAAVSPAIIVPCMIELRNQGFGNSIPSLLMSAASLDDIVAITGFTICIRIALDSSNSNNLALSIFVHGPLTLFIGVTIGVISGVILAIIITFTASWQRTVISLEIALLLTFFCDFINFDGSGAVASILAGGVVNAICKLQSKVWYSTCVFSNESSLPCADTLHLINVRKNISVIWNIAMRPLLFGTIGASFDVEVTRKEELFKGTTVVFVGLTARVIAAYVATSGLSFRERLFVSVAWIPKATVQAALCSVPLSMMLNSKDTDMTSWGKDIVFVAVLSIVISAPLGLLSIKCLAPRLLTRNGHERETTSKGIANSAE